MIPKKLDEIVESDLQYFVDERIIEKKTLEYKKELPGNAESDKGKFLATISSFANTRGGDLIFGIRENQKTKEPEELVGLDIQSTDQVILRLENIIRTDIEPRAPGIDTVCINLSNSKKAIVIRVPKSWISPHRVKKNHEFYSRATNGRNEMDVDELRIAFNLSETITERIRRFREDRISNIMGLKMPVRLIEGAKVVLHLLPIISLRLGQRYDIDIIPTQPGKIKPMTWSYLDHRYNIDGYVSYSKAGNISESYVQLYRNGIIESVDGKLLRTHHGDPTIPCRLYEETLIKALRHYINTLRTLDVEPPIFLFLTLLGVNGYRLNLQDSIQNISPHSINRDNLLLPEVLIESYDVSPERVLKPCFDSIWNACGYQRSFNYNEAGEWTLR